MITNYDTDSIARSLGTLI